MEESNLYYSIKRLFEIELGFSANQFDDESLLELSKKALALQNGYTADNLNEYVPKKGRDGLYDYQFEPISFMMNIEKVWDVEIKDEEAEQIMTYTDLAKNIEVKRKDRLYIHQKYFDELLSKKSIDILIVGRDPYPKDKMGIPFCKEKKKKMQDGRCSGKYLLKGLNIDIDSDERLPEQIFFDLLREKGVGFINASYFFIGKKIPKDYQIQVSNYLNNSVLSKSKTVIVTKSALALLKRKLKLEANYIKGIDSKRILSIGFDKKMIEVLHPDARNKKRDEHKILWNTMGGLLGKIKDKKWLLSKMPAE